MSAAARAVESLRPDAFVVDPLAHILAGPKAMAKYKVTAAADRAAGIPLSRHQRAICTGQPECMLPLPVHDTGFSGTTA